MLKYLCVLAVSLLVSATVPATADAAGLSDGFYQLTDGQLPFSLNVRTKSSGKLFLSGQGALPDGRNCRVGDLAELRGGQLLIGSCAAGITLTNDGFTLNDASNCFQCVPGLSASGSYKRSQ